MKGISRSLLFLVFALVWPGVLRATQSKTYPTAATTQVRWDTYLDSLETIGLSTWTVETSTWVVLGDSWTWINPDQKVGLWRPIVNSTGSFFIPITLEEYTSDVVQQTRERELVNMAKVDMEEYMVWPDTFTVPDDWLGWCSEIINGHDVPVACPN